MNLLVREKQPPPVAIEKALGISFARFRKEGLAFAIDAVSKLAAQGDVDYKAAFETFKQWIVHVHIKDGKWDGDTFQRTHLGEGEVDVRWVMDALDSIGYEGDYALEYEVTDIEPVETGLKRWYDWFEAL